MNTLVDLFGTAGAYGIIALGVLVVAWVYREWRFHAMISSLEALVVKFPNYADVRGKLADAYMSRNYIEKAEQFYKDAIKIYPFYVYAHFKLGFLYHKEGRCDEMFEEFWQVLEREYDDKSLRKLVEDAILEAGYWDKYQARLDEKDQKTAEQKAKD
jgi:tetratricopeptide (TPR) repeat protein